MNAKQQQERIDNIRFKIQQIRTKYHQLRDERFKLALSDHYCDNTKKQRAYLEGLYSDLHEDLDLIKINSPSNPKEGDLWEGPDGNTRIYTQTGKTLFKRIPKYTWVKSCT